MVESGITPQISFQAGRLSWLCIEVNNHKLIITQNRQKPEKKTSKTNVCLRLCHET
jgi:hypothetical protein